MRLKLLSVFFLTLVTSVQAQDDASYAIEVLVLEHLDAGQSAYRWPGEPDTSAAMDLLPPLRGQRAGDRVANDPRFELNADKPALADAWSRLRRSGDYRPLAHIGWQQPALAEGAAKPVRIRNDRIVSLASGVTFSDESPNTGPVTEVDGQASFEQRRFKHIRLDIAVHRQFDQAQPLPAANGEPPGSYSASYEPVLPYQTYRIRDSRQVRPGNVYYFDHRQFGVLVSVNEVAP